MGTDVRQSPPTVGVGAMSGRPRPSYMVSSSSKHSNQLDQLFYLMETSIMLSRYDYGFRPAGRVTGSHAVLVESPYSLDAN